MDLREISFQAVVHNLVSLVKYAVFIILMVLAFKFWASKDICRVDSEDPSMRPAVKSTKLLVPYDRNAWSEADLQRGDVAVSSRQVGENREKFLFRVVAVQGEWVENDPHGRVVVNGQVEKYKGLEPEYIKPVSSFVQPRMRMPRGYVLLFADNRQEAKVASPGLVPVWMVMGKAQL